MPAVASRRRPRKNRTRKHSRLENLESRRLLAVISVQDFGATPNDGGNDAPAIQRAIDTSSPGDTILFGSGTYDLNSPLKLLPGNRTYRGQDGATLRGRTADGQLLSTRGSDITITGLTFDGGGLFFEDFHGFNEHVVVDNNVFKLNTSGPNANGITFTTGLMDSKISNNLFTGYTGGFGIYGYNYNGLTIANNEFVNVSAGMHIDAFTHSSNLIVEQNYITGAKGMGMEFQSSASNLVFQDNWFEHPNLSTTFSTNNNSMAFSLILDKSSNITIRRNTVIAPERPDGTGCRIGFEVGGDNTLIEQNYLNGINNPIAMTDGSGTASVTAQNNLILNNKERPVFSFPSQGRSFAQVNNGSDVQLNWDINRGRPQKNHRYGEASSDAAPVQPDENVAKPEATPASGPPATSAPAATPDLPRLELPTLESLDPTPPAFEVSEDNLPTLDLTPPPSTDVVALDVTTTPQPVPAVLVTPPPASKPIVPTFEPHFPRASLLPVDGLATPADVSARVISANRVDLTWTDNSFTESGYVVERSSDGANWSQVVSLGPSVTRYASTNLTSGQTYFFRVCAVSTGVRSEYSQFVSATTLNLAAAVTTPAVAAPPSFYSPIQPEPFRPVFQPTIGIPFRPARPPFVAQTNGMFSRVTI